ncbi:colanic acid biosynthesis glycosyltransferase WcaL, partial [Candidatus Parcubacteria bacterium]|nr:colanic acid biosynthesis glycosyltransferase WcaL [Candidatus Parcubacteria bacterium]
RDGKTGMLIPPLNDEALYRALKNIEADPEGARVRAAAAKLHVEQHFAAGVTVDRLIQLL